MLRSLPAHWILRSRAYLFTSTAARRQDLTLPDEFLLFTGINIRAFGYGDSLLAED